MNNKTKQNDIITIMKNILKKIYPFLFSLITTFSFYILTTMDAKYRVLMAVVFIPVLYVFYKNSNYSRDIKISILSFILTSLLILGKYVVLIVYYSGVVLLLTMLATLIGSYLFFTHLIPLLFKKIDSIQTDAAHTLDTRKLFIISFLIILLLWVPFWLAEYPNVLQADTAAQFNQVLGISKYDNLNPLLHTLFLKLVYSIVSLFTKDMNVVLFVISFVQMILNSLVYAYVTCFIYKKTGKLAFVAASILFYSLISFNVFFNVSISKDSAYAACLVLLIIAIHNYWENNSRKNTIFLVLIAVSYSLVRANGYFTFIFSFGVLLLLSLRNNFKKHLLVFFAICLVTTSIRYPIYNKLLVSINDPSFYEIEKSKKDSNRYNFNGSFLYAIPFQQVANVVVHERPLTEYEEQLINAYIDIDKVKDVYNPILVDPLFYHITVNVKDSRKTINTIEYVKLWLELMVKYPGDYLEAFTNMNRYYYYPNRYVKMYSLGIANNRFGVVESENIPRDLKNAVESFYEQQHKIPLLGSLYSAGVISFVLIIAFFYSYIKKNFKAFISMSLLIGNLLVLIFFVPLNDEFRYFYPIAASLPLIILMMINNCKKQDLKEEHYD